MQDIWTYLDKLSDQETKNILKDYYTPLPSGVVTDGFGNLYNIPKTGKTPLMSIDNDRYFKYRYNWETNEIEVFSRDIESENSYNYLASFGVSASNFIDNPEYWYRIVAEDIEESTGIDLSVYDIKEAIDSFDEYSVSEINNNYKYEIKTNILIVPILDEEKTAYFVEKYEKDFTKKIDNLVYEPITLYGQILNITSKFNTYTSTISTIIEFPLSLSKEEVMEIYNEYVEPIITSLVNKDKYRIDIQIESMFEV